MIIKPFLPKSIYRSPFENCLTILFLSSWVVNVGFWGCGSVLIREGNRKTKLTAKHQYSKALELKNSEADPTAVGGV